MLFTNIKNDKIKKVFTSSIKYLPKKPLGHHNLSNSSRIRQILSCVLHALKQTIVYKFKEVFIYIIDLNYQEETVQTQIQGARGILLSLNVKN